MATFEIPQHPFEQNELNNLPFCKCGMARAFHPKHFISDKK